MSELVAPEDLTPNERKAFEIYMRLNQPPMAPSAQAKFLELYLQGTSCEEIHRLNPGGFSLGAIVRARIENNWDEARRLHQERLAAKIKERVQQVQMETIERVAIELAASNKLIKDKALRYIQTGNEAELTGTNIGSLKHLKEMSEIMLKLTGQDKNGSGVTVNVSNSGPTPARAEIVEAEVLPALPAERAPTPEEAANLLDAVLKAKNKGEK